MSFAPSKEIRSSGRFKSLKVGGIFVSVISPASETLQKRYGEDEDTDSRMAQHIADHATNPLEETKEGFEGLTNGAKLKNELKSMSKQR